MVEVGIALVDNLYKIFSIKTKHDEKYFYSFIEPMFKDAEMVMNNYTSLLNELISKLEMDEEMISIIKWLRLKRIEFQPLRMKMRVLLEQKSYKIELAEEFQKGIWGLLKGGLQLSSYGHYGMYGRIGVKDHTILDLVTIFSEYKGKNQEKRERYIRIAKDQLQNIENAWVDVVTGYVLLKQKKIY